MSTAVHSPAPNQQLLALLDSADFYAEDVPPATFGLSLVPPPAAAPPPEQRTLRERLDATADLLERIDAVEQDPDLSPAEREAATKPLIESVLPMIAGTKDKVDATNATLAMYESLAAAARSERDRLAARVRKFERNVERLESYVLATLEASKLDRLDGHTSTLERKLNPASVVIAEGAELADEFLRYPDPEPDKVKIKAAIKARRAVPGASLVRLPRLVRS